MKLTVLSSQEESKQEIQIKKTTTIKQTQKHLCCLRTLGCGPCLDYIIWGWGASHPWPEFDPSAIKCL